MIRSSRRTMLVRGALVAAVAAIAPLATSCEAGNNAPTLQISQAAPGTDTVVGNITISNAFVLGAPLDQSLPAGGSAGLFLALVNSGTASDTLLGIGLSPSSGGQPAAASVRLAGGPVRLPPLGIALLAGPQPTAVLEQLTSPLAAGSVVNVVLTFRVAGNVPLSLPVMPRAAFYSTYSPPPPTPRASASPAPGRPGSAGTRSPSPSLPAGSSPSASASR